MLTRSIRRGAVAGVLATTLATGALVAMPAGAVTTTATATVALSSSVNPSQYGQAVTLRAVVTDPSTPRSLITGTMTYLDGSTVLGTKAVTNGAASFATPALDVGVHSLTASFSDTAGDPAVVSDVRLQTVVAGATTTALKTSKAIAYNGQPGSLTATVKAVSPARGTPTGYVDFYVDGSWWWTAAMVSGKATMSFADIGLTGAHDVTATYTGDGNFGTSSSGIVTQTILPAAPTAGLTFTPSTITVGGVSRLVVSAKNDTPVSMPNVAMGVLLKLPATVVSQPAGIGCRRAYGGLLYCMTSLPAGATRNLVLDVTGSAPGAFTMSSYARNIDTGDETGAVATLTVQ